MALALVLALALCACGARSKDVALKDLHEAVKAAYGENYLPNMAIEEAQLTDVYGVKAEDVEEFLGEAPMISAHVDTFLAVKAKAGRGEEVEKALTQYRDYVAENAMMYPMNMAKVQAAKVIRQGDYVFYLMLGAIDDRLDASEEEQLTFAQQEVQRAVDAIEGLLK